MTECVSHSQKYHDEAPSTPKTEVGSVPIRFVAQRNTPQGARFPEPLGNGGGAIGLPLALVEGERAGEQGPHPRGEDPNEAKGGGMKLLHIDE